MAEGHDKDQEIKRLGRVAGKADAKAAKSTAALAELKVTHGREREALQKKYEGNVTNAEKEHEKEIKNLETRHGAETRGLQTLLDKKDKKVTKLESKAKKEKGKASASATARWANYRGAYAKAKTELSAGFEKELKKLEEQCDVKVEASFF